MDAEKEELNRQLQEKDMFLTRRNILPGRVNCRSPKLEKNQVTVEQTGRMPSIRFPK